MASSRRPGRGELHRVPQGAGLGGALRLGLGGGGIAAHQPFYQLVVYKKACSSFCGM